MTTEEDYAMVSSVKLALAKLGYTLEQFPPQEGVFVVAAKPMTKYGTRKDGSFFVNAEFANAYKSTSERPNILLSLLTAVVVTEGDLFPLENV